MRERDWMAKCKALRQKREEAGVTIDELAAIIDVNPATLSRWERGHTNEKRMRFSLERWEKGVAKIEAETKAALKQVDDSPDSMRRLGRLERRRA